MNLHKIISLLFCLFCLTCFEITYSKTLVEMDEPRQYGYVLGDVFTRKLKLNFTEKFNVTFDKKKYTGRINNWLSIRKIDSKKLSDFVHSIEIQYQVVNVPPKPLMISVPSFEFKAVTGEIKEDIKSPDLLVTLAPITPEIVVNRGGLLNIQPNNSISEIKTENISYRISIWISLLILPILIFIYSWAPWQKLFFSKKLPFSSAYLEVLKLKGLPEIVFWKKSLTLFHFALNSTAKKTVFVDSLDDFFLENLEYKKLSNEIRYFLMCSRKLFYENETLPQKVEKKLLIKLIQKLSLIEKKLD